MRFSEHDIDAIEDVAAFCGDDPDRSMLAAVWIGDGWAMGTDAYRLDAREVDTDWAGAIDPVTLRPVAFETDFERRWMTLKLSPRHDVASRALTLAQVPDVRMSSGKFYRVCLGCLAYSVEDDTWWSALVCGCSEPLVDLAYLRQALAHFDEPVRLKWESSSWSKPVRLDEPEHFHLLMPVPRR